MLGFIEAFPEPLQNNYIHLRHSDSPQSHSLLSKAGLNLFKKSETFFTCEAAHMEVIIV